MNDEERLAAHRARRGVKKPQAQRSAERAARNKARYVATHTTIVECYRCGGAARPGWRWKRPVPCTSAASPGMEVCAKCTRELEVLGCADGRPPDHVQG